MGKFSYTYGQVFLYIRACSNPKVARLELISCINQLQRAEKQIKPQHLCRESKQAHYHSMERTQGPWDGLKQK